MHVERERRWVRGGSRVDQRWREKGEGKRVESEIETNREAVSKGEGERCSV